jgi:four helix bundle protein
LRPWAQTKSSIIGRFAVIQNNVLLDKTLEFSVRIVRSYQYLTREKHEEIMAKQLLRSGTSIGANAHEAVYGTSKQDFIAKLHIALKEASETEYWLILLTRTEYLTTIQSESLMSDCLEIKKILIATLNKTKKAEA